MLAKGKARKLTVFVNETDAHGGKPLYQAVVELAHAHGIAGATVTRAMMGFGTRGRVHSTQLADVSPELPIKVEIIDTEAAIERILPQLESMVGQGLIELSDVEIVLHRKQS